MAIFSHGCGDLDATEKELVNDGGSKIPQDLTDAAS
jgi:hypothetical protein